MKERVRQGIWLRLERMRRWFSRKGFYDYANWAINLSFFAIVVLVVGQVFGLYAVSSLWYWAFLVIWGFLICFAC